MKKLLVMLLALCMVLSMSVALVACGGDDDEPASNVDSSIEDAASKGDITSEEPVVSDEPVVSEEPSAEEPSADETSDEVSEEPSEEPSSAVAYEYKTSVAGTNYATNSTYTAYRADLGEGDDSFYLNIDKTSDWADVENTKLTDGVVGDPSTYDSKDAALAGVTVQYAGTNKDFVFEFDLGDHYGDIKSLEFLNVRHGTPNGNNRGFAVKLVQYSDDGINWTRVKGTLTGTQVAGAVEITSKNNESETNIEHFNYVYTFDQTIQCKYIKITLIPGDQDIAAKINYGYVLQLEEIRIKN